MNTIYAPRSSIPRAMPRGGYHQKNQTHHGSHYILRHNDWILQDFFRCSSLPVTIKSPDQQSNSV